jgi:uncharacterized membrane protein
MESKAKAFGHPIHPMLIVLPLGLFITAVICDIIYLINHVAFFPVVSYYNIAIGIIGGLLAAVFGFRDWLAIPAGTRAKGIGLTHGLGNVILVVLFLVSWLIRRGDPNFVPSTLALVFSFAAIILGTITAWLGGEMVYRLDVAVDPGANLDAPNSLSGAPASEVTYRRSVVPVTGEEAREDHEHHDQEM